MNPIPSIILQLLGGLAMFMYGMELASEGIQRAAGHRLQKTLNFMTKNSLMAVLTGTLVTIAVQSSSATTVMMITFVNAGLLSLTQGIGVIMGANIGTTLTGWIIAAVGIAKFSITALAVPIFGIGFFMAITKKKSEAFKSYGNALMGLAFIFLGLGFIATAIPKPSTDVLLFLQNFSDKGYLAILLSVLAGTVFTILVHASSATMAVVISLAAQGILDFNIAAALTLGANIGTTVDAFVASVSVGANASAKRAAWAHILFNLFGTVWVVMLFKPFMSLVQWIAPGELSPGTVGIHIAMLHTLFNSLNTLIMLPFVKQFAALLERFIKEKPEQAERHAMYLPQQLMATPELSLLHARKEIANMAGLAGTMFQRIRSNIRKEPNDFESEIEWFTAKENFADMMHEELSCFLLQITTQEISESTRDRVGLKLRIISELESMTDECLSIAYLLKKKHAKQLEFEESSLAALVPFSEMVDQFLRFVSEKLETGMTEIELGIASEMEDKIDAFKKHLKKMARKRLKAGADVKAELLYIDLIRHVEKVGDCSYAIAAELRNFGRV